MLYCMLFDRPHNQTICCYILTHSTRYRGMGDMRCDINQRLFSILQHISIWYTPWPVCMCMLSHLTAITSVVVMRARGVYWWSGGRDVDDVWVHQLVLLVQQVKDPDSIGPIWGEQGNNSTGLQVMKISFNCLAPCVSEKPLKMIIYNNMIFCGNNVHGLHFITFTFNAIMWLILIFMEYGMWLIILAANVFAQRNKLKTLEGAVDALSM